MQPGFYKGIYHSHDSQRDYKSMMQVTSSQPTFEGVYNGVLTVFRVLGSVKVKHHWHEEGDQNQFVLGATVQASRK